MADFKLKLKPVSVIEANIGIEEGGPVHAFFTQTCYNHMVKYTPFKTGKLAVDNVALTTDTITYNSPYAHYLYEGRVMGPNIPIKEGDTIIRWFSKEPKYYTGAKIRYDKSMHEKATSQWDKVMWANERVQIIKEIDDWFISGRTKVRSLKR